MKVSILGIGNYSEVIIELCEDIGYEVESLFHFDSTRNGDLVMGFKIKGDYEDFLKNPQGTNVVVGIGDNRIRSIWLDKLRGLGFNTINLVHPTAYVSKSAQLGEGVYIHAGAFIWTSSKLSNNVIISPQAMVAHHTLLKEGVSVSANAMVGSYVEVGKRVMIGINAGIVSKRLSIGKDAIIGANSMVLGNVEEKSVMVGSPAKKLKNEG